MNKQNKGIFLIIIAALIWSFGGLCIKIIKLDPISIACARATISAIILLPFIKFSKIQINKNSIMLAIGYTWTISAYVVSTKITTAANAIMLQYTSPLWLFMAVCVNNKKLPPLRVWLSIISIFCGLVIFLSEPVDQTNLLGNLIGISSGISFAITTYYMAKPKAQSTLGIVGINNLIAAVCLLPFFNFSQGFSQMDTVSWFALLYQGLFQLGGAYIVYHMGLKIVPALKANIISLLEPLCNPIWVFIFIGELPSVYAMIGSIFILAGIILETVITNKNVNKDMRTAS